MLSIKQKVSVLFCVTQAETNKYYHIMYLNTVEPDQPKNLCLSNKAYTTPVIQYKERIVCCHMNTIYCDWELLPPLISYKSNHFMYSEPLLQGQHLFPKTLPLKRICCCTEYLKSRLTCKKGLVLFLFPHRTYVLDIFRIASLRQF